MKQQIVLLNNMGTISYKNRERLVRGQLQDFNDLPEYAKENFIKIKKFFDEYYGKSVDVYVFGSFHHGFWDEFSDYDVLIYESNNSVNFTGLIQNALGIKVDVLIQKIKLDYYKILIP